MSIGRNAAKWAVLLFLVPVLIYVLLRVIYFGLRHEPSPPISSESVSTEVKVTEARNPVSENGRSPALLGVVILQNYADTNHPPEEDLTLMAHLMENSLLLLKSAANRPLSANEDWADFLRGKNSAHERFLPEHHAALDDRGHLVDRWGTPLFFHALGSGRYELRSAGPDKTLWTADDIHRNADGSFRRGGALNSPSLLEEATRERSPATAP